VSITEFYFAPDKGKLTLEYGVEFIEKI